MATIPYAEDERTDTPPMLGPRLVIAFSCTDPMRQHADWSPRSIELAGAAMLDIGRSEEEFKLLSRSLDGHNLLSARIPDGHLSQRHLHIIREPGDTARPVDTWTLHDAGSSNGVWVNGVQVTKAVLADHDVIEIGMTVLVYRTPEPWIAEHGTSVADDRSVRDEASAWLQAEMATLNPSMMALATTLQQVAPSTLEVLVTGPTGAGKEVVAWALHQLSGRTGPFVPVNCAALPPELLVSELFGVQRGAYTGAETSRPGLIRSAQGGTLFLDEVAELSAASQAALLRVLQDGQVTPVGGNRPVPVDVRVLAATHQDLAQRVEDGRFRNDLLARLCGVAVAVPPLCARREDIGLLIARLLPDIVGAREVRFTRQAGGRMFLYHWPNNVRELKKTLHAAVLKSGGDKIRLQHLPRSVAEATGAQLAPERALTYANEADRLRALYQEHQGNLSMLARVLNTSRTQVRRLLQRAGIDSRSP